MKIFNNLSLVLRSSVTALEEKVQNPERMLHQLIIDMDDELEQVRAGVAAAIADEIQLRNAYRRARSEADDWQERARSAMARGDEARAEAALAQQLDVSARADNLGQEHQNQQLQVQKLQTSVNELEDKIRQARQKQTLLQARLTRARTENSINQTLRSPGTSQRSAFAQFSRFEQQVEREEALGEAYDRLDGRDPDADELARQFAADERRDQLKSAVDALRQRVETNAAGGDNSTGSEK